MKVIFHKLKEFARIIKGEIHTIYLVARHPRTPKLAKLLAIFVVAYALSPIDLIPDFIPVLGYLDDLIIVPLGIYFLLKIVPQDIIEECRKIASEKIHEDLPSSKKAAAVIITLWLIFLAGFIWISYSKWVEVKRS